MPLSLILFEQVLNSDIVWKVLGMEENPPHTPEEFHLLQFHELIDRSTASRSIAKQQTKGTCFNELVDAHREPET